MQKLKKVAFGAANGLLLLAPAVASAQLTQGNWTAGSTNAVSAGLPTGSIYGIISSTLSWLLAILGFIAVMGFVISGILYLTAAGNEAQIEKAKNAMTYSIIGVIVALMGYVIIQAVGAWLGTSANF
ncbi:MAG: hypothetical protein ACEQSB_03410 [Undibacterium sp.]